MFILNQELRLLAGQRTARKSPFIDAFFYNRRYVALDGENALDDGWFLEVVFDQWRRVARALKFIKKTGKEVLFDRTSPDAKQRRRLLLLRLLCDLSSDSFRRLLCGAISIGARYFSTSAVERAARHSINLQIAAI